MIPRDFITEWRAHAPWADDAQVEQDLVISRALVELFRLQPIAAAMAFRGGTALNKLHLREPARYSEDIDLVQVVPGPIGPALDSIRSALDPWLGTPRRDVGDLGATLVYRFDSEGPAPTTLRLKIEINTREQAAAAGLETRPFAVGSRWFQGQAQVRTFELAELLGTKLRALYQRRKGRDLFDLALMMRELAPDPARVVASFHRHLAAQGHVVSRAQFERNLGEKLAHADFARDVAPLLRQAGHWDAQGDAELVRRLLIARLG